MFLADLPDALEFDICARDLVHRLADTNDWNEPSMAAYLKECTFYMFDGKHEGFWRSGLGDTSPAFTSYVIRAVNRQPGFRPNSS